MARRVSVENVVDMTGGLNLSRDSHKLASNESPDLMNVDVDPRGGFYQRKGVAPFGPKLSGTVRSMWQYHTIGGINQIMAQQGGQVVYSTGGSWTHAFNRQGNCYAAVFKSNCYVVDGRTNSVKWDGDSADALFTTWNDNLENPIGTTTKGTVPIAKSIASHMSHLWVANTLEGGIRHPNRVRFSHPNFPEDWRSYDFIDIDPGVDDDEITALMPYGDRLLIFKKKAIYALYGYSPETYQVVPVSREIGTVHQGSVINTDIGIYFWSWPDGLFLYQGKTPEWQFERLYPAIEDGFINYSPTNRVMLGWGGRRLWLSSTYAGSDTRNRTWVLDPRLNKQGSWVQYDLALGPYLEYQPPGEEAIFLAADVDRNVVLKLEQNQSYDNFGTDNVPIESYYRTKFFDFGQPVLPKRWRRPEFVMQGGTDAAVYVKVYRDWDWSKVRRDFTINPSADAPTPGGALWGTAQWDEFQWAAGSRDYDQDEVRGLTNEHHRGSPLGNARAIALEFVGPANEASWGVNTVSWKYIPRKPKS